MAKRKSTASEPPAKKLSLADLESESDSGSEPEQGSENFEGFSEHETAEEDAEEESEEEEKEVPAAKKTSNGHAPSAVDVRVAGETSELFKTNVFKLQIDELLSEIKLDERCVSTANKTLFDLNQVLTGASNVGPVAVAQAAKALPNRIPFEGPEDANYSLAFVAPKIVNIAGSYSLKTAVRQPEGVGIDVYAVMPRKLFEAKDYLNYRYAHKRAFYVAALAHAVSASKLDLRARYVYLNDNPLRPALRLDFADKKVAKYLHIIVHVGVEKDTFVARKLGPGRNAVRAAGEDVPTPLYNASVLGDLLYDDQLRYLHTAAASAAAFVDACKLGRLWLRQRGYSSSPAAGGFGHHEFAMLMAMLLNGGPSKKRVLLQGYSSYQLFRGTLLYLCENGVALQGAIGDNTTSSDNGRGLWFEGLDVLAHTPAWALKMLRHDAGITCDMLSDVTVDRFSLIFLKSSAAPTLRFDVSFVVDVPTAKQFAPAAKALYLSAQTYAVESASKILKEAWKTGTGERDNRATEFAVLAQETDSWSLASPPPAVPSTVSFTVGALLDPEQSDKKVTLGPEAGDKAAIAAFREFWGPLASMRRFQDGAIKQAVVWRDGNKSTTLLAAQTALERHLDASVGDSPPTVDELLGDTNATAAFQAKIQSFQSCSQMLQELQQLPLRIAVVYGTSSSLRYTSLKEPAPYDLQADDAIASGIIQFESSGKWPTEFAALEKTKTALLIKIADVIRSKSASSGYSAVVGVEPIPGCASDERGILMVQTPQGYYFKLTIVTTRDQQVVQTAALSEDSQLALQRSGQAAADHNRLISTMAQRYALYSASARVLKLWFKKHLLGSHLTQQAIELLALKPFVDSPPFDPPCSAQTAFNRSIAFLASWNWKDEPVLLDVDRVVGAATSKHSQVSGTDMDLGLYQKLNAGFIKERQNDPALTLSPLFIGTKLDAGGVFWTKTLPRSRTSLLVCSRMTALARGTNQLILSDGKISRAFKPALADFDVEFKLYNPSASSSGGYKNLAVNEIGKVAKTAGNIGSEFFDDLQEAYRDSLILFYSGAYDDRTGKHQVVTGIWNRDALQPHKFRVNLPYSTKPAQSKDAKEGDVILNRDAVLSEISRLGGDLIKIVRT